MVATRTLTVWCPDWPMVAAGVAPDVPAAAVAADVVTACTAAARAWGVRHGLRRREAQRRCPDLRLVEREETAEIHAFEPVVVALEVICPRVEVVRPGLCLFATKGPSRYFGGDGALAGVTLDAAAGPASGGPVRVGIADGRFASALAARANTVVPVGTSAAFLASYPVTVLDRPVLTDLLLRLGLPTLGDVAAVPSTKMTARFGLDGALVHRLCRGLDEVPVTARVLPPELTVEEHLDPPVETVEPLAFIAKSLADTLQAELAQRALVCTRVLVEVETEHGETRSRLWRYDQTFTAGAVAQRVRWQLTGWLTGPSAERPTAGITLLRITPDEVHRDVGRQLRLFGNATDATEADERAVMALTRLQGLIGFEAIRIGVMAGGRQVADSVQLVPWSEPTPPPYDGTPPWPGRLPAPSPSVVHPDLPPVQVVDAAGAPVRVSNRGIVLTVPHRILMGDHVVDIDQWAGPWLIDQRWWDSAEHRRTALFQMVSADGVAWLLAASGGRWVVEGMYD